MSYITLRRGRLGALLALLTLAASFALAQTSGSIRVVSVQPSTINPNQGQQSAISYTLPTSANFRIYVRNSAGTQIRGIGVYQNYPAGTRGTTWNGRDANGRVVADGLYTVVIEGTTTSGAPLGAGTGAVTVKTGTTSTPAGFTIVSTLPATINPTKGERAAVKYTASAAGNWQALVRNGAGTQVRYIGRAMNTPAGTYGVEWDGKDSAGKIVPDGLYHVTFEGTTTSGTPMSTGRAPVTVKTAVPAPSFTIVSVTPTTIDPSTGQMARVAYTAPATGNWKALVRDGAGAQVRYIGQALNTPAGNYSVEWNGKNDAGATVPNGSYQICFEGATTTGTPIITGKAAVTVQASTVTPPPPPPSPSTGVVKEYGYPIDSFSAFNWEGWRYGDARNKFAAAFTAEKTGTISRLAMEWKTQGSYGRGNYGYYDLIVVPADAHGWPDTNTVLASQMNFRPLNGGQPRDGWQIFDGLNRGVNVVAGKRYWMVISARDISGGYSCPNTASSHAIRFVDTNLYGMDSYVVASYNYHGAGWRGWLDTSTVPASWRAGHVNTTSCTQRGAISVYYTDGFMQGQAGYWGSGASGNGYDNIYPGMMVGEQIAWNRPTITIDRLSFFVAGSGSSTAGLNWMVKNVTTGATLASGTIPASSVSAGGNRVDLPIAPTIQFVRGQTYRISLSTTGRYRFYGACYDAGAPTTLAGRYATFTGSTPSQTSLVISSDGVNWTNVGNGRGGYAFELPFSIRGWE